MIPVHSASWKCSLFRRFRFIIYLNCSLFCDSASSYIYNTLPPIAIPFYHISETRALIWRSRFITYLKHGPSFAIPVHHVSSTSPHLPIPYIVYLKHATSLGDNIRKTRTTNTNTQKPICYSGSSYILNTPPHLAIPVPDTSDTRTLSPLLAITKWNLKLAIRRTTNTKPIQINFHFRFTIYLKHPPGFRDCGSSCILNAPPLSRFRFDSYLKHAPYITSTGTRTSEVIKRNLCQTKLSSFCYPFGQSTCLGFGSAWGFGIEYTIYVLTSPSVGL